MSLDNRYEFVFLFDVKDGNPNGDPDAGNLPRVDAETGQGLVTDVCLKRKVRNYVGLVKEETPPFEIYIKEKAVLNRNNLRAYEELGLKHESKKLPKKEEDARNVTQWMCQNFFDIRTFGAVMSTDVNTGQVRGPVQMNFARSIEPVVSAEHSITRMAVTTEKEAEQQSGDNRTMGRKFTIPYGLYRSHGFISANLAKQTGFGEEDLELLWDALINMLDHDRSASRGEMSPCALYVFKHESPLGNAPARKLFDLIDVNRVSDGPARDFKDYQVSIREDQLPSGVQLIKYLE
ncbi:type I-C CRISPR-associated protein Cas7/Csd2 [Marinobacter persicus]|uniref:CRISPR-associated Csd2 family protein n=1 Tax=Marinobacter persicus TaxID=930118 RepID=A0A2S6G887_9GAMM|nr:type I-C CRISPR-associated protein Cas7/Csd2 [Marinobacter persicus]PPK52382.1 CRISPR-associated Csd2 family protein [Marinobacter persicus]PPK55358.1 CRISPR-associated Csd2 family protein [Marinobacter persicus]PPK59125.1 CRISPR-associated Csd2 family protein [Marinobacter persicus]